MGKKKKKILFVTHSSWLSGGAEKGFDDIIEYFKQKNDIYELWGIFPKGPRENKYKKIFDFYLTQDICFMPVSNRPLIEYVTYLRQYYYQKKIIDDFLQGQNFDACFLNVAVLLWHVKFIRKYTANLILLVRETIFPVFLRKLVYRFYNKIIDTLLFVSESNMKDFTKLSGRTEKLDMFYTKVEIINMENIDCEKLNNILPKSDLEKLKKSRPVLICSGNIDTRKNQLLILKAMVALRKQGNIMPCALFVGDDKLNKQYSDLINKYIKENDLNDNVVFTGHKTGLEYYILFSQSDIFIISSISEGLPLVLIEAMGLRKSVISTNVGGISDIIENNKNGILVRVDEKELSDAVQDIWTNEEKRNYIINNGYKTYLDYINKQEKSVILLEEIINKDKHQK